MTLEILIAAAAAIGLGLFLGLRWSRRMAAFRERPDTLFGPAKQVLEGAQVRHGDTAGVIELSGRYEGQEVRVKAITDTLAVRKLPSLWLMVTLPGTVPVQSTFDLMMRPAGPSTFSNFDNLPVTVALPSGFPEAAVVRTDDAPGMMPLDIVKPHLGPFFTGPAKELLISPKGVRLVYLLAEGDRARYGVFRQADFGDIKVSAEMLEDMILRLIVIRHGIAAWRDAAA